MFPIARRPQVIVVFWISGKILGLNQGTVKNRYQTVKQHGNDVCRIGQSPILDDDKLINRKIDPPRRHITALICAAAPEVPLPWCVVIPSKLNMNVWKKARSTLQKHFVIVENTNPSANASLFEAFVA
jgi:hypothetical protein